MESCLPVYLLTRLHKRTLLMYFCVLSLCQDPLLGIVTLIPFSVFLFFLLSHYVMYMCICRHLVRKTLRLTEQLEELFSDTHIHYVPPPGVCSFSARWRPLSHQQAEPLDLISLKCTVVLCAFGVCLCALVSDITHVQRATRHRPQHSAASFLSPME